MVGIYGTLGDAEPFPSGADSLVAGTGTEATSGFDDGAVSLRTHVHSSRSGDGPATADDGTTRLWLWGDVHGCQRESEYEPRPAGTAPATYAARHVERMGLDAVTALNGDYAMVVYDQSEDSVHLVTDRVGSRPLYRARPDGDVVFASNLHALCTHPDVDVEFDEKLLYEYLQIGRVFGVETPIEGVQRLPPGSVVTVDLDGVSTTTDRYWRPTRAPVDRSFDHYADRLAETVQRVVTEWVGDRDPGVLLSGGSDSRLLLAALDGEATAFHVSDWWNRETRTANRVAAHAGADFRYLERDVDYAVRALDRNASMAHFAGWFDQAYFSGFESELRDSADVLLSGLYADTLFKNGALNERSVSVGAAGTIHLPLHDGVDSLDGYLERKAEQETAPLDESVPFSLRDVLDDHVYRDDGDIVHHGLRYDSLEDVLFYAEYYPLSAHWDAIFDRSLTQTLPYRTPFLDDRLLELHQRIPQSMLLRRDLVGSAVQRLDPALADLPHATSGVPLRYPLWADYLGRYASGLWRKVAEPDPPEPHQTHESWGDRAGLLRHNDGFHTRIREWSDRLDALPFPDSRSVVDWCHDHREGADHMSTVYALLTLLSMPVVERAENDDVVAPDATTAKPRDTARAHHTGR